MLVVGTDATYPPFEFIDESGKLVGFDVDLLEEIAKRAGFKLKWVSAPFDGLIAAKGRLYLATTDGKILCMAGDTK